MDGRTLASDVGKGLLLLGCLTLAVGVVAGVVAASLLWWIFS